MIVYHGSIEEVVKPEVNRSYRNRDFGQAMTDGNVLEQAYREALEESIVAHLSEVKELSLEQAMDVYYSSNLSEKINDGKNDIQYLDYRNLVRILIETEPELFE